MGARSRFLWEGAPFCQNVHFFFVEGALFSEHGIPFDICRALFGKEPQNVELRSSSARRFLQGDWDAMISLGA